MPRIDTNRIEFMNTYIDNLTFEEAKEKVDQLIKEDGYHYVVTPNSDIVVKMQDDLELKNICDNADLILTDGQIVVKISKYLGNPIKERVCMTDFVWHVFDSYTNALKVSLLTTVLSYKENSLYCYSKECPHNA